MKLPRMSSSFSSSPSLVSVSPVSRGILPCDVTFADGWDEPNNNNVNTLAGNAFTEQDIRNVLSTSASDSVREAYACGCIVVKKGCHQPGSPHITLDGFGKKKLSSKCEKNLVCGSRSLHVSCTTGAIL